MNSISPCPNCAPLSQRNQNSQKLARVRRSVSLPVGATARTVTPERQLEVPTLNSALLDPETSKKFLYKSFKIVTVSEKRKIEREINSLSQLLGGHPVSLRLATDYINALLLSSLMEGQGVQEAILQFLEIFRSNSSPHFQSVKIKTEGKESFFDWTTFEVTVKEPQNELVQFISTGILKHWFTHRKMEIDPEKLEKVIQWVKTYHESFLQSTSTRVTQRETNLTAEWLFQLASEFGMDDTELVTLIVDTVRGRMDTDDQFDWFSYLHKIAFVSLWPKSKVKVKDEEIKGSVNDMERNYGGHKLFLEHEGGISIVKNILARVEKRSRRFSCLSATEEKFLDWIISLVGHGKDTEAVELLRNDSEFMAALRKSSVVLKKVATETLGMKELDALHKILLIWFALLTPPSEEEGLKEPSNYFLFEGMPSSLGSYQQTVKRYRQMKDTENLQNIWPIVADKCQILIRFMNANEDADSEAVDLCKGILRMVNEGYF